MHAPMRGSVHVVSRQAGRLLDTGFSPCLHNCMSIHRLCCALPSTERRHREWHVVCTRFSCNVPRNTTKQHGLGTYIGLEGRLTWSVSTLARGSLAFQAFASPGVKYGGELSKYASTGLYLACGKWHGTMPSWGMKWATA
jgi:hypothetical protein